MGEDQVDPINSYYVIDKKDLDDSEVILDSVSDYILSKFQNKLPIFVLFCHPASETELAKKYKLQHKQYLKATEYFTLTSSGYIQDTDVIGLSYRTEKDYLDLMKKLQNIPKNKFFQSLKCLFGKHYLIETYFIPNSNYSFEVGSKVALQWEKYCSCCSYTVEKDPYRSWNRLNGIESTYLFKLAEKYWNLKQRTKAYLRKRDVSGFPIKTGFSRYKQNVKEKENGTSTEAKTSTD